MNGPARDGALAAAVFDLGGVVFRYDLGRRLTAFAAATGRDHEALRKALMDSGYSRACDAGRLNADAAHREGVRLLGSRMSFESFRERWISAFEPDVEVVALVRRLRQRLPVAMLTNNSHLVRSGLDHRHADVMELFRPRLFSADAGVLKPDPRLFRTLLDLMNTEPHQVLYVDDEPACADAAAALGLQAYRFRSAADLEARLRGDALIP